MKNLYGEEIRIEVVQGGFVLSYPVITAGQEDEAYPIAREVFVSPRKLNQKLKEVIETLSLVKEPT